VVEGADPVGVCRFVVMKALEAQRKRTKNGNWSSHGVDGTRSSVILTLDDTSPGEDPESAQPASTSLETTLQTSQVRLGHMHVLLVCERVCVRARARARE
jgi:hypothetical protein